MMDAFTKVADQTSLQLAQWAEVARQMSLYQAGEVTGPGTLVCDRCGAETHFVKAGRIPPCADCGGARLKPEALLWRLGASGATGRGLNVHDLMLLPIERTREFFAGLALPAPLDEATDLLLGEIRSRLDFLVRVGLGYLTLDRQSRTLSGGEVQRINLTTALGTSLTNTLFVLDEPSIGLHPRDMRRVIEVMERLRDNGNSLLVVEHDPQIMLSADRIVDLGPGPGEHGGRIVFNGTPAQLAGRADTLTAQYLSGRKDAVDAAGHRGPPRPGEPSLVVEGASEVLAMGDGDRMVSHADILAALEGA
jgi:excinuclease ABC subunit A